MIPIDRFQVRGSENEARDRPDDHHDQTSDQRIVHKGNRIQDERCFLG